MLHNAKTLTGYALESLNGNIGKVKDLYFDDQHWTIRYLVANTGSWLTGRQVLISPYALVAADEDKQHIEVNLSIEEIEDSPSLDTDKPVSRQFEEDYYAYYDWPMYWGGPYTWGNYPTLIRDKELRKGHKPNGQSWDPHLRSTNSVRGHYIHALDGDIGHVVDFIIDDKTWIIRHIIVDTTNWWPGKKVIISPQHIDRVSWDESKVFVNLTRETIKHSLEHTDTTLLLSQ